MSPEPSASIILCTRNRAASLGRTLHILDRLEAPAAATLEIVVVDNGSTDDTPDVVQSFADKSVTRVRYVREASPGLSAARNRGVDAAHGAVLLFTDDDCLPASDWAVAALRVLCSNPCQIVAGRVELHDPADDPVTTKTSRVAEILASPYGLDGFLHGCNMVLGRAVIDAVGMFDTRFGAGSRLASAEDTDLVYRALKAGIAISYDPSLTVYHDHGRRNAEQVYRLKNGYRLGMGGLAAKYLLTGDAALAKSCYWHLRSALRDYSGRKAGFSHLLTESRLLLGALRFVVGTVVAAAKPVLGRVRFAGPTVSYPEPQS